MILKVLTVVGARPQFIKAAVVSRAIEKHNEANGKPTIQETILHTGQHYDERMSDVFFDEMGIPKPHHHFNFNRLSHGAMTGRMLEQIEAVILEDKPDILMVYGDTNSTLAGALSAVKCQVPILHVEAGLRSNNMAMPEEVNRILTDRISNVLCCPTQAAVENLAREGFGSFGCVVTNTGDVMYDAVLHYSKLRPEPPTAARNIVESHPSYYLATLHRAENTDNLTRLAGIVDALNALNRHTPVVVPLHPRTKTAIDQYELNLEFTVIEPVGYFDMLHLLSNCKLVLTDSGGLQKEAFFFKKPCVTLRDETEWTELTDNGFNTLAGAQTQRILEAVNGFAKADLDWSIQLYGDGRAGDKIVKELVNLSYL